KTTASKPSRSPTHVQRPRLIFPVHRPLSRMKVKPGTEPATGVPVGGAPGTPTAWSSTGVPFGGAPGAPTAWSSGLFDCFDDCGLCMHAHTIFLHDTCLELLIAMKHTRI
uniref:Uncharacterized protein n=1 Tax=Aegilops tauschii subsp. strangulata TaxID=200361 RepID=A0A453MBU9_AEGTS